MTTSHKPVRRAATRSLGALGRAALVAAAAALIGFLVGHGMGGGGVARAGSGVAAGAAPELATDVPDVRPAGLALGELLASPRATAPEPSAGPAASAASARTEVSTAPGGVAPALLAELRQRLAARALDARYAQAPEELLTLAIDVLLHLDGPAGALPLVAAEDVPLPLLRKVAGAFEERDAKADAAALWRRALLRQADDFLASFGGGQREGVSMARRFLNSTHQMLNLFSATPFDSGLVFGDLEHYRQCDLDGALALMTEWSARATVDARRTIDNLRVEYLMQAERRAEAGALLAEMQHVDPENLETLGRLAEVDPAAAEPLLRQRLAAEDDPNVRRMLVNALQQQGRLDEALAAVGASIPSDATPLEREHFLAQHSELIQQLDGATLLGWLGGPPRTAEVAQPVMTQHVARGDHDAALGVYAGVLQNVADNGDDEVWWLPPVPSELIASRGAEVERAVRNIESSAELGNDEVLGDLADVYMQLGRHEDALRLYERARRIDPEDGEWHNGISNARSRLR